jgi:hypothetical protein
MNVRESFGPLHLMPALQHRRHSGLLRSHLLFFSINTESKSITRGTEQYPYLLAASAAFIASLRSSRVKRHGATWRLADNLRVSHVGYSFSRTRSVTAKYVFGVNFTKQSAYTDCLSCAVHDYPRIPSVRHPSPKMEVTAPQRSIISLAFPPHNTTHT